MELILKQLILIAGAWKNAGYQDMEMEKEFGEKMDQLQAMTGLDRKAATDLLVNWMRGEEVA